MCSINEKMEKYLVKDVYFYGTFFAILHSIFNGKHEKECLFLCYVVVGNKVACVFDFT